MDGSSEAVAEQHPSVSLDDLDPYILATILKHLSPKEVIVASLACRFLHHAAEASVVWQHLYDTALSQRVKERLLPPPDQITDWRAAVVRGLMLGELQFGLWERLKGPGRACGFSEVRPCAREGHAAASWGRDSMILFGGWGSGIRNDLFILDRVYDQEPPPQDGTAAAVGTAGAGRSTAWGQLGDAEAARDDAAEAALRCRKGVCGSLDGTSSVSKSGGSSSSAGSGGGGGAAAAAAAPAPVWLGPAERPCSWRWRVPRVAGRRPAIRYGHSITRCGAAGELLVVYGGMQSGGYTAEINSLAVLRPYTGGEGCTGMYNSSGGGEQEYEYEWFHPELHGDDPGARGYHAAAASEDGLKLYIFGGIARRESIAKLAVIDLTTWTVERLATTGAHPPARFGCSLVVYDNRLWVVGGGNGSDLARSGYDLTDVHCLDLARLEWSRVQTANRPHSERALGRCHTSCMVGSKLVMFGGSLELSNDITWLDLDPGHTNRNGTNHTDTASAADAGAGAAPTEAEGAAAAAAAPPVVAAQGPGPAPLPVPVWGTPAAVLGSRPGKRMSAVMVLSGSDLVVFGGWIYSSGEMGDLSRFRLLLPANDLARAKQCAAESAAATAAARSAADSAVAAAAAAAGPSGSGRAVACDSPSAASPGAAADDLSELLSAKIARYYRLMRTASTHQEADGEGDGGMPMALVREMHETMMAIRLLRSITQPYGAEVGTEDYEEEEDGDAEDEEGGARVRWIGLEDDDDEEEEDDDDGEAEEEEEEAEGEKEDGDGAGLAGGNAGAGLQGASAEYDTEETGEEETSSGGGEEETSSSGGEDGGAVL